MSGTNGNGLAKGRPAWMERAAALVSDADLTAILSKQIEKAKAGDDRAARFVLDFVGKSQPAPSPVNATQYVINIQAPADADLTDPEERTRLKALALVEASGPLTAGQIAARMDADPEAVERAVDHPWFKRGRDGRLAVVRR